MSDFKFNGISASSMGLMVERIPRQHSPKKRITSYAIPGRSGVLHQWDGAWENYTQRYECWFKSSPVRAQARKIKEWLHLAPAGARLEDSYDGTVFHLATYAGGGDIENIRDRYGRFVLDFDCDPRAFLKSGDNALTVTSSGLYSNPTQFDAYPLLEVTGSVSGTVAINGVRLLVLFPGSAVQTIKIDTYLREAWQVTDNGDISKNELVTGSVFPVFAPGFNSVSITGGISSVRIIPRWWTL